MPSHAGKFGQRTRVDDAEEQQNKRGEKIKLPQDPDNGSGIAANAQQNKNRMNQCQEAQRQHSPAYLTRGAPDRSKNQRRDPVRHNP